eukprot:Skav219486  [mRNA]  locus=scaffold2719:240155:242631:+ [translate_table: standard]
MRGFERSHAELEQESTAGLWYERLSALSDAASGLSHMHNSNPEAFHRVDTISGTPGYACPIYARTGQVTEFSEVYSFGMVILEVLTAIPPAMADNTKPGGGCLRCLSKGGQDQGKVRRV